MSTGFGTGQVDLRTVNTNLNDVQLRAAAGDHTALLQLIERHLSRLESRYVEPIAYSAQQINIQGSTTNFGQRIDFTTTPHNSVILSVIAGTLNLWVGDYSGMGQSTNPQIQIAAGTTQQLFLPLNGWVYTIVNPSSTVALLGSLIPVAL